MRKEKKKRGGKSYSCQWRMKKKEGKRDMGGIPPIVRPILRTKTKGGRKERDRGKEKGGKRRHFDGSLRAKRKGGKRCILLDRDLGKERKMES